MVAAESVRVCDPFATVWRGCRPAPRPGGWQSVEKIFACPTFWPSRLTRFPMTTLRTGSRRTVTSMYVGMFPRGLKVALMGRGAGLLNDHCIDTHWLLFALTI